MGAAADYNISNQSKTTQQSLGFSPDGKQICAVRTRQRSTVRLGGVIPRRHPRLFAIPPVRPLLAGQRVERVDAARRSVLYTEKAAAMVYHVATGSRSQGGSGSVRREGSAGRAALLGVAAGLGTMIWLASLAIILWRLPLGVAGDFAVLLIVFCALPISLLVGAAVFSNADPRGRGPTDAPPARRRPQYLRRPPHDMF